MLYGFISKLSIFGEVLEVGCGCGVLGLLLKRDFKNIKLKMLDIQEVNAKLARKNADSNSFECDIFCADFLSFKNDDKFDFIITNPPFYRSDIKKSQNEHMKISRYSEYLNFEALIKKANSLLKPKGSVVFCYDAEQIDMVFNVLNMYKFKVTKLQFIYPNEVKNANLIAVLAQKSSKSICKILPPIYINNKFGYHIKAVEIFKKADLSSFDE